MCSTMRQTPSYFCFCAASTIYMSSAIPSPWSACLCCTSIHILYSRGTTLVRSALVRSPSLGRTATPPHSYAQHDVMMAKVLNSGVADGSAYDSESECGDDGSTGVGGIADPQSYAQVSSYFGPLESFAESCKNDETAHNLQKARMPFIKADRCFETSAAADIRQFASAWLVSPGRCSAAWWIA